MIRFGIGLDIHPLRRGRPMFLGCVRIPSPVGPAGHSDADVLAHALCDALLGAAGLGDMGLLYPDTDPKFRGYPGRLFLKDVLRRLRAHRWRPAQADCVLLAERPRLAPHLPEIRRALASVLGLPVSAVNVKAKRGEGLGAVGRGRAIQALAVAVIRKSSSRSR